MALEDFRDNLVLDAVEPLPFEILQKLYRSRQLERSFREDDHALLTSKLGFYCDLQSLSSEDAITWSFFGPLSRANPAVRGAALNWILRRAGLPAENTTASISLWRRVAHPDTLGSGGPELDFALLGDRALLFGEAKWSSPIGRRQGKARNKNQLELRHDYLRQNERSLGRGLRVVLEVRRAKHPTVLPSNGVEHALLTWAELAQLEPHPRGRDFERYLAWKESHQPTPPR